MRSIFKTFTLGAVALVTAGLLGCGGNPHISNTEVSPKTWAISGIADSATFTITTDVRDLSSPVTEVVAGVEGTDIELELVKVDDIAGGERWSATTELTLWKGLSTGTHDIFVTAKAEDGDTITKADAAEVVVTD